MLAAMLAATVISAPAAQSGDQRILLYEDPFYGVISYTWPINVNWFRDQRVSMSGMFVVVQGYDPYEDTETAYQIGLSVYCWDPSVSTVDNASVLNRDGSSASPVSDLGAIRTLVEELDLVNSVHSVICTDRPYTPMETNDLNVLMDSWRDYVAEYWWELEGY